LKSLEEFFQKENLITDEASAINSNPSLTVGEQFLENFVDMLNEYEVIT
jgi:hypothetical protein